MTAATVARCEVLDWELNDITSLNVKKVTAFRKDGDAVFRQLVEKIKEDEGKSIRNLADKQSTREYKHQVFGDKRDRSNPRTLYSR